LTSQKNRRYTKTPKGVSHRLIPFKIAFKIFNQKTFQKNKIPIQRDFVAIFSTLPQKNKPLLAEIKDSFKLA
jgi:hypothetical protein